MTVGAPRIAAAVTLFGLIFLSGCSTDSPEANNTASVEQETTTPTSTTTTTEPPRTTVVATPFTTVGSLTGAAHILGNDDVVVATKNGTVSSFETDGTQIASMTLTDMKSVNFSCGMTVLSNAQGQSHLIAMHKLTVPARGVEAEQTEVYVTSWDTSDFSKTWTTKLVTKPSQFESGNCGQEGELRATIDGRWLTIGGIGEDYESYLVDADSGKAQLVDYYPMPVGRYVGKFIGNYANARNAVESTQIFDPATNNVVASFNGRTTEDTDPLSILMDGIFDPDVASWYAQGDRVAVSRYDGVSVVDIPTASVVQRVALPELIAKESRPFVVEDANILLVGPPTSYACIGGCPFTLAAFDLDTFAPLWVQPTVKDLCTANAQSASVEVNDQMAILDIKTGEQRQYSASLSSCGDVYGAYGYDDSGSIYRLLD